MKRKELIEKMAQDAGITKTEAENALKALLGGIQKAVTSEEGKIILTRFGTFYKLHQKARKGRNPATGEEIMIEAGNVVKFKPGKTLKEEIN